MKVSTIKQQSPDRKFLFIIMPGDFYKPKNDAQSFEQCRKKRIKFLDSGIYWDMQRWNIETNEAIFSIYQTPQDQFTKRKLEKIGIEVFEEKDLFKFLQKISCCKEAPFVKVSIKKQGSLRFIEIMEFYNELMLTLYDPGQRLFTYKTSDLLDERPEELENGVAEYQPF